jgi:hypothetical protein
VLGREGAARASLQSALSLNPLDRQTLSELQLLGG